MGINLKIDKPAELARFNRRLRRKVVVIMGRRLNQAADMIISEVKSGSFFDNPTGKLQESISKGRVRRRRGAISIDMGWGVPYGKTVEFGPRKKTWKIRARFAKALRFQAGGGIVFAKEVTHRWTPAEQRPHFAPTIKRLAPRIRKTLGIIVRETMK